MQNIYVKPHIQSFHHGDHVRFTLIRVYVVQKCPIVASTLYKNRVIKVLLTKSTTAESFSPAKECSLLDHWWSWLNWSCRERHEIQQKVNHLQRPLKEKHSYTHTSTSFLQPLPTIELIHCITSERWVGLSALRSFSHRTASWGWSKVPSFLEGRGVEGLWVQENTEGQDTCTNWAIHVKQFTIRSNWA